MVDEPSMMKRLLICLTCCAMIIGAIGHASAMRTDPSGGAMASVQPVKSQLSNPIAGHTLVGMAGCTGHVHNASGGCTVDAVAPSLSFNAPDRIWRANHWIETGSHLRATVLSPVPPPPISMS
jgi:hypothetical protein